MPDVILAVIKLVEDFEKELMKVIGDFGLKINQGAKVGAKVKEKVSQADVEGLFAEFGL